MLPASAERYPALPGGCPHDRKEKRLYDSAKGGEVDGRAIETIKGARPRLWSHGRLAGGR